MIVSALSSFQGWDQKSKCHWQLYWKSHFKSGNECQKSAQDRCEYTFSLFRINNSFFTIIDLEIHMSTTFYQSSWIISKSLQKNKRVWKATVSLFSHSSIANISYLWELLGWQTHHPISHLHITSYLTPNFKTDLRPDSTFGRFTFCSAPKQKNAAPCIPAV